MAFSGTTHWEFQTGGDDTNNGGGFDPSNGNMATDLAATVATSITPIVTSASYNFSSTDIGHWLYVKSGTNWKAGWYPITAVSLNAATINATAGAWVDASTLAPSTTNGCASVASPTSGTWSVDYSQATPPYSYTDMVIDGTTNTKFTSSGHAVGKNLVGNIISVVSGTGFTVQRVQVSSVTGTTATCDKSLGTLSSTGGHGSLGGPLASGGLACGLMIALNKIWGKTGDYTCSSTNNVSGGRLTLTGSGTTTTYATLEGYGSIRGDKGTKPKLKASSNSMTLITMAADTIVDNIELALSAGTETSVVGIATGGSGALYIQRCKFNAIATGISCATNVPVFIRYCEFLTNTTGITAPSTSPSIIITDCTINGCTTGVNAASGFTAIIRTIFTGCTTALTGTQIRYISNCTINGGTTGATITTTGCLYENMIISNASGTGYSGSTSIAQLVNCAAYNNGTDFSGTGLQQEGSITLTADPYTNVAGTDFSLNNTSSGGLSVKAKAYPTIYPGLSSPTNYLDVGAYQHQDTAMSGTKLSDITQLTAADVLDLLYLVDVSDTTDNAAGSSKRILVGDFLISRSVSRGLFDHYVNAGSVSTTETDLYSDSIAASTLSTNGDGLYAEYGCTLVNSSSTKKVKVYFGGTAIFDSGALTISASSEISISVTIIRVSSTVIRYNILATTTGASTGTYSTVGELTGLTLSNVLVLKITGTSAGSGVADNDIIAKLGKVIKYPAAA